MKRSQYRGYIDLAVGQVGMAINVIVAKFALPLIPLFFFLSVRFAAISVMLTILLRYQKTSLVAADHPTGKVSKRDLMLLFATGMCAGPLFNILMMSGAQYTTATSVGIVMSVQPAMLMLFSFWILGERLNARKVAAIFLAITGVIVLSLDNTIEAAQDIDNWSLFGNILVFLGAVPQALYSIFSKLLQRRLTVLGIGLIVNIVSATVLFPFGLYEIWDIPFASLDPAVWGLLTITVLSGTMFNLLWGRGLSTVPAGTAAVFTGVMPVATSIIAIIVLGEIVTPYDFAGMFFVLLSIVIGTGIRLRKLKKR